MGDKIQQNKRLWQQPWGYFESFIIAISLLIIGVLTESVGAGAGIKVPGMPYNLLIGAFFLTVIIILHFGFRKTLFVKWLSGINAAISSIVLFSFLVLLMGFIPQSESETSGLLYKIGLSRITNSWFYLLAIIYLLISLGMVTLRRCIPFKKKKIGFLLNHFGLWLTIFAASLGTGDMKTLSMTLQEGKTSWMGYNAKGKAYEMPIAFKLIDFNIEEYNPKIVLIDNKTGELLTEKEKLLPYIEKGLEAELYGFKIKVINYIKEAVKVDSQYHAVNETGAPPAAFIEAYNKKSVKIGEGWISCGSFLQGYDFLKISDKYSVIMLLPEAKKYSSRVRVYSKSGINDTATVEVNKPYKINGWNTYQVSYNDKMGKWSDISVIELVKDPWLPVVYIGIFMLIAGSIFLFWQGKKVKSKENELD